MPTVLFVNRLPPPPAKGAFVNFGATPAAAHPGLRETRLDDICRRYGESWQHAFVNSLGALNASNAVLEWWAYTSTAKNLLSSPLGNRIFQVLAVLKLIEEASFDRLYVVGASPAQTAVLRVRLRQGGAAVHGASSRREFASLEILARLAYHALRIALAVLRWRPVFRRPDADVHAFTYVDGNVTDGNDTFFGRLPELLDGSSGRRVSFLAYVQAPYRFVLPKLAAFQRHAYWPLYFDLTAADLAAGLRQAGAALNPCRFQLESAVAGVDITPLLQEAFRWDVAKGGYLFNVLAYRAARRFGRSVAPARVLIPFENKSLEKSLILGLREGAPACRIVGYQHTSVTPRHTTLLFAPGEARATPLPDIIVTVGDITREYLERNGGYPAGIFATGCALRQSIGAPTAASASARPRILLALSSSPMELARSIEFFTEVDALCHDFDLGVRPHPEFPLSLLPERARAWVAKRAADFSGTPLAENLEWCTEVAYVSSTVALEAMMRGRPVINIDLGEMVIPDPALGNPPLWRQAGSPAEFLAAVNALQRLGPEELASEQACATSYLRRYFRPVDARALTSFLL